MSEKVETVAVIPGLKCLGCGKIELAGSYGAWHAIPKGWLVSATMLKMSVACSPECADVIDGLDAKEAGEVVAGVGKALVDLAVTLATRPPAPAPYRHHRRRLP